MGEMTRLFYCDLMSSDDLAYVIASIAGIKANVRINSQEVPGGIRVIVDVSGSAVEVCRIEAMVYAEVLRGLVVLRLD